MVPKLYGHPFSSYTWKALIAFHETGAPFEFVMFEPGSAESLETLRRVCPIERFPVLETDQGVFWESSIIAEMAQVLANGPATIIPADAMEALRARERDRVFDGYVMAPMQTVVADGLRPVDRRDPHGVERARQTLDKVYGWLDGVMAGQTWATGESFTLADCSAAPALFYADWVRPLGEHVHLAAYLKRLRARPSVKAAVEGARPFRDFFPLPIPAHVD